MYGDLSFGGYSSSAGRDGSPSRPLGDVCSSAANEMPSHADASESRPYRHVFQTETLSDVRSAHSFRRASSNGPRNAARAASHVQSAPPIASAPTRSAIPANEWFAPGEATAGNTAAIAASTPMTTPSAIN